MCIKIIRPEEQKEFNPSEPLEMQVEGADRILVSYDPVDTKIDSFLREMERLCRCGISCNVDIKVNTNNYLSGLRFQHQIEKLKKKLDINEIVKDLTKFHWDTDRKLNELSKLCASGIDEQ
jgi:hypothetical protein